MDPVTVSTATSISSHFVGIKGGLLMSIIAFCIVFIVCAGLMAMMYALKAFAGGSETPKANTSVPAAPAAPAAQSSGAAVQATSDDGELLAVISAAIAAACGAGARVVSFAPAAPRAQGSAWRMTGRLQNSEGFQD